MANMEEIMRELFPDIRPQSKRGHQIQLAMRMHAASEVDKELKRLCDWVMDDKRQPALTAFTLGQLRNAARAIELKFRDSIFLSGIRNNLNELLDNYKKQQTPIKGLM